MVINKSIDKKEISDDILGSLKNGNHDAYNKVYIYYYSPILEFLSLLTKSKDDAQEITQQVFIVLWEKREYIDPKKNIKGFLYTIARNFAMNYFEHKKVKDKYAQVAGRVSDIDDSPYDIVVAKELEILIRLTLNRMPKQRRKVMEMKLDQCKSNEEIAKELKISPETVKGHITKGKKDIDNVIRIFLLLLMLP